MEDRDLKVTDIWVHKTLGPFICIEFLDDEQRKQVLGDGNPNKGEIDKELELEGCTLLLTHYEKFRDMWNAYNHFHYGIRYIDLDENNRILTKWQDAIERHNAKI